MKTQNFELLLPVGQKEMALAAIHNGADAIFVGFPGFNARGRSYDFELTELKEIIDTCHLYGVKVNLAFNIVIFQEELPRVTEAIYQVLALKPDALIVQDLGLINLIRQIAPKQVIHASTQMTVTNDLAIKLLDDLNIKRFVLGRENSIPEIKLIKAQTEKELEVFVHGALCVSYSGQCFTSESIGGRSANRGQCAQSCRFSYDLSVDDEIRPMDKKYLVSPQDLCGLSELPELMKIGVTSYKVEGRLKSPEYVATVAREYRKVMNDMIEYESQSQSAVDPGAFNRLAMAYSRGFFSGWLHGVNHQKLVNGTYSAHRGAEIGKVIFYEERCLVVELNKSVDLSAGDGLLWVNSKSGEEFGSYIYSIEKLSGKNQYKIGISKELNLDSIFKLSDEVEFKLYQNHSQKLKKETKKSFEDKNLFKRIPINVQVKLGLNKKLWAVVSDGRLQIEAFSDSILAEAQKRPLSDEDIRSEFSSLGGSVFSLNEINILREDSANLFLNAKELKVLRQNLIAQLVTERTSKRIDAPEVELIPVANIQRAEVALDRAKRDLQFNILLRKKEQVSDLVSAVNKGRLPLNSISSVILDFEFARDYAESVVHLRDIGIRVGIATTRILKPQEYQNLKNILQLKPDIILVRNLGALYYYKTLNPIDENQIELRGDFSLNITNHLTAEYLLNKGLKSVCLSYDLNSKQVADLLLESEKSSLLFEITIHQFMPSFHMEHCVFAAFLSQGTSYRDCGKPCEKHQVKLKDQFGNWHWIKPDPECRNTMYNAKAQTALKYVPEWKNLGLGSVRYEALNESGDELISKIDNYVQFLKGHQDVESTIFRLETNSTYGLSEGSFDREHKYVSRKKR